MMAPSGNAHMLDVDGAWSDLLYSVYAFGRMMWKLLSIISDMPAVHMLIARDSTCTILLVLSKDMNECTRRTSKHDNQTAQCRIVSTRYLSDRVNGTKYVCPLQK